MSEPAPYLTPEEVSIRILTQCCETLEAAIKDRKMGELEITGDMTRSQGLQVHWKLPKGVGWISLNDWGVSIRSGGLNDLRWDLTSPGVTPATVKVLIETLNTLGREWVLVRAATMFSKLF